MSLELCAKVAAQNSAKSAVTYMRGLRIKGGNVMATDTVNIIKASGIIADDKIDCYVDSESFLKAYSAAKEPKLTQIGDEILRVEDGKNAKLKIDIELLDPVNFRGADPDEEPDGESVEPKDFLASVRRIAAMLKQNDRAKAYYLNGFIYCSDGNFLVRTPTDASFPEKEVEAGVSVSKQFADLLAKVKKEPVEIVLSEDTITVVYDDLYIASARFAQSPGPFEKYFQEVEAIECTELPQDVYDSIKIMVASASGDDKVIFSPMGISYSQGGKVNWTISHPMPYFQIKATWLATIINNCDKFNFEKQARVVFQGKEFSGIWGTAPSGPPDKAEVDDDDEDDTTDGASDEEVTDYYQDEEPAEEEEEEAGVY